MAVLFRPPAVNLTRSEDDLIGGGAIPFQGAVGTLRHAIETAPDGYRVAFDASISGERITLDQAAGPIIHGSGDIAIDAGALEVRKDALICNCDFENNLVNGSIGTDNRGGALYLVEGLLVLRSCEFEDNDGNIGGGAVAVGANSNERSLLAQDCTFNRIYWGGGLLVEFGEVMVRRTSFQFNDSGDGGAIAADGGDVILENATLSGNSAGDNGGGLALLSNSRGVLRHVSLDGLNWEALQLVTGEPGTETSVTLTPGETTALLRVRED